MTKIIEDVTSKNEAVTKKKCHCAKSAIYYATRMISPHLWRLQDSFFLFNFDNIFDIKRDFYYEHLGVTNIDQIAYADDHIHVISFEILNNCAKISQIEKIVTEVYEDFNLAVTKGGGVLNCKKTEIICASNDVSPGFDILIGNKKITVSNKVKWLGFMMYLSKKGLFNDMEKTISNIKSKCWDKFKEFCLYSRKFDVRINIFEIFVSSIISFHLVGIILSENSTESLEEMEKLQRMFLYKAVELSHAASGAELLEFTAQSSIKVKLDNFCSKIWDKLDLLDFTPSYSTTRSQIVVSNDFRSKIMKIKGNLTEAIETPKFDFQKFNNWRAEKILKVQGFVISAKIKKQDQKSINEAFQMAIALSGGSDCFQ